LCSLHDMSCPVFRGSPPELKHAVHQFTA